MWIEIEYKDYELGVKSTDPTIHHAIINSDMITEIHIESKTIKGHADLYYELTDDCFNRLIKDFGAKHTVKTYNEDFDIDSIEHRS